MTQTTTRIFLIVLCLCLLHLTTLPSTPAHASPTTRQSPARPAKFAVGQKMTGFSAWYGQRAHGNRTTSGKVFDSTKLTAAHRTLPFGTMVKVTNLKNKKSVVVQITDRGPTSKKLIIDISRQAAINIGMRNQGIGKVTVEILSLPASYKKSRASK